MVTISLPPELEYAVSLELRGLPPSQWLGAGRSVSARYRGERNETGRSMARGREEALGYAAMILPAAYAQLRGAMSATAERVPGWLPATMLDIGSGPGTALWAAADQWPSLREMVAWEREAAFIDLGRTLARASANPAVKGALWQRVTLGIGAAGPPKPATYDLVVLGHVLNELSEELQESVVALAWERCAGVLFIVEPGTSSAFPVVKRARERLLASGAFTLAPCAHDRECPLVGDWCHFPQRLNRPAYQRRAKEGTAGWEESKFSYVAMSRFPVEKAIWGRLIHQPHAGKAGVDLTVSSREGIVRPHISKRDRAAFRLASSLAWGEALEETMDDGRSTLDDSRPSK
jgi:ribosomal protein RSM22 (predicted rRNA methylase)